MDNFTEPFQRGIEAAIKKPEYFAFMSGMAGLPFLNGAVQAVHSGHL